MNRKKKVLLWLSIAALAVAATAVAQIRLRRYLDENYGRETEYYQMGEMVAFGENYQTAKDSETLAGYSMSVDDAQVMTYEAFLAFIGQTEDGMENTYGIEAADMAEKVCLLTITLANADSTAQGVNLEELFFYGDTYDLYYDSTLTTLANDFLREEYQEELAAGRSSLMGLYLDQGETATIYLAYDFIKGYFSDRHWERLGDETLWLHITSFPVEKIIVCPLG
jgi:hypothetical protein